VKNKSDLSISIVVFLILDVILGVIFFLMKHPITWSTTLAVVLALIYWYFPQIGRLVGLNRPKSKSVHPVAAPYYDYYQINSQLDDQTCPECGARDGRIYRTDEARPGINYPPFHDGCRCVATPCTGELPATNDRQYRDPQTGELKSGPYLTYTDWRKAMRQKYGQDTFK